MNTGFPPTIFSTKYVFLYKILLLNHSNARNISNFLIVLMFCYNCIYKTEVMLDKEYFFSSFKDAF